ncbi:MAG: acyl-CoA dehydrogenase family protein [Cyanobacteria bacterium J06598_3]
MISHPSPKAAPIPKFDPQFEPQFDPQRDAQALASFLDNEVTPAAHDLDTDPAALFEMFREASDLGLLTPKSPAAFGGGGLSAQAYRQLQCEIAQRSGALAFLLTQHQSAASFLLSGENETLKKDYLPKMASGETRVGVGFSHLRRVTPPLIASPVPGGYRLSGEVPWVTGDGVFEAFVGAAVIMADGKPNHGASIFGLLPLGNDPEQRQQARRHGGALVVDQPMALSGMAATNTVRVRLADWFLADDWVIGTRPAGWLAQRDRANPLSPLGLIQGCTEAAQAVTSESLRRRQITHNIEPQLAAQTLELFAQTPKMVALPVEAYEQKVAFRGQAIALMNTCAQAAVIASSGAANALNHPARRVQGEALVFSVSGQSTDGAIASLNSLMK